MEPSEIKKVLSAVVWQYADKDPRAYSILRDRVAETGAKLSLITYSDLVKDVEFHLPNIRNGAAYTIQTYDWSGLDRRVVGDFLGYLSMESYTEAEFMASALVVNRLEYKPSEIFFEWLQALNVLPDLREETVLAFWADQVNKAHNWYKAHSSSAQAVKSLRDTLLRHAGKGRGLPSDLAQNHGASRECLLKSKRAMTKVRHRPPLPGDEI